MSRRQPRKAAVLYGRTNTALSFRKNQVTHDLYVSEVLLRYPGPMALTFGTAGGERMSCRRVGRSR